jgi:hypothetical protein
MEHLLMVEHNLSEIFRHNPNAVFVFAATSALVHQNPVSDRLLNCLNQDYAALLPTHHSELVQACLANQSGEQTCEVTVGETVLALTYFPIKAFDLVYVYAIEVTPFKVAEEELMRLMASAVAFTNATKHALIRLKKLRRAVPQWISDPFEMPPAASELDQLIDDLTVSKDGRVSAILQDSLQS